MAKVPVLQTTELAPGESRVVEVEGHELAVFNVEGQFHVLSNICPHVGGPLGEGTLDGQQVICPWHGWRFNVTNGGNALGSKKAHCYRSEIDGSWLLVELGP